MFLAAADKTTLVFGPVGQQPSLRYALPVSQGSARLQSGLTLQTLLS